MEVVCLLLAHLMVVYLPLQASGLSGGAVGLHPIVLVPGSGGNRLEARLTDDYQPSSILCSRWARSDTRNGKWFRLWFDATVLLPYLTKCFAERMTLQFDESLDDYRNAPGVETRVPYFGSTKGLIDLDPHLKHITGYMGTLVKTLEEIGYKDGVNLFGAPYDFRYGLAASGHPCLVGTKFLENLRKLVENVSDSNNGKPVIILSHSLGNLFVLNFLNMNPLSWRNKYIKHFVALSPPWGGTVQEMLTFASGYTLGIPIVNPLAVRAEQRSSESNMWLLPSPQVFDDGEPLVVTLKRNHTVSDMTQFLEDIGFPEGVKPYETRTLPLVKAQLVAPFVPVTCMVGSGVHTPEKLLYGEHGFDEQPAMEYGDGDGTVNMRSLAALEKEWNGVEGQRLKVIKLPMVSHTSILKDDGALREIARVISEINSIATKPASSI